MIRRVSRGGIKLNGFLRDSGLSLSGLSVLDIGASHGGFTQEALAAGARKVYALDVGKGILDWKLRKLPEVIVMEGVNARNLRTEDFPEPPEVVLVDVSFISLIKILPPVFSIASEAVVALLKPQFEAGYSEGSKGEGVITDETIHIRVIEEVKEAVRDDRWEFTGVYPSDIKGKKGNSEYFLYYLKK